MSYSFVFIQIFLTVCLYIIDIYIYIPVLFILTASHNLSIYLKTYVFTVKKKCNLNIGNAILCIIIPWYVLY